MDRRARARAGAALVIAAALAACGEPASDEAVVDPSAGMATVTFRLWDDAAADAYRESFDAFNAVHRDIHVEVEVVPEPGYADRTASDLADGTMADIFWTTSDAVAAHAHAGDIVELDEALGEDLEEWEPAVTELYTRDDGLWAVPQLWDSTVLFYNTALVERAGVDPEALVWDPDAGREETPTGGATPAPATDTLRQAVRALTRDGAGHAATDGGFSPQDVTEHGINPDLTAPAVWLPLLAQLGGLPPTGDDLTLTTPEARATFDYLTRLPAAASRVATPARELFTTGRLALFWSTSADMRHVAAGTDVDWGLAPVPSGPDGTVAVADGVGAAANAASADPEATAEVLRWLASTDGQSALASHGVGIPAATGAQELFLRSWADRGVDASAAVDPQELVTAASGPRAREMLTAVRPVLDRMFRGELPVAEALAAADQVLAP